MLALGVILLLFSQALAAKPTLRVCTGTVCVKHGAALVLDSAAALSSSDQAACASSTCVNLCVKSVAVQLNGQQVVFDACSNNPLSALDQAAAAYEGLGVSCGALKEAIAHKYDGDLALAVEDWARAVDEYSMALKGAPPGLMQAEQNGAAAVVATTEAMEPPLTLVGVSSVRLQPELIRIKEATMPGRVRWLHEALLGRSTAYLALGDVSTAKRDAMDATALCPLAHGGWQQLAQAAAAAGDQATAADAASQVQRLMPEGWEEQMAKQAERAAKRAAAPESKKPASKAVGVALYGTAFSLILAAIAYRQVNPVMPH